MAMPAPGRIARVVRIRPLEDRDPAEASARYRAACLSLSPDERVEEMRRLSRRVTLLNPAHPRSPRIDRTALKIVHDAV